MGVVAFPRTREAPGRATRRSPPLGTIAHPSMRRTTPPEHPLELVTIGVVARRRRLDASSVSSLCGSRDSCVALRRSRRRGSIDGNPLAEGKHARARVRGRSWITSPARRSSCLPSGPRTVAFVSAGAHRLARAGHPVGRTSRALRPSPSSLLSSSPHKRADDRRALYGQKAMCVVLAWRAYCAETSGAVGTDWPAITPSRPPGSSSGSRCIATWRIMWLRVAALVYRWSSTEWTPNTI
jgi:hypothetical protein